MEQKEAWDIYFTGIVGWSLHPGYLKNPREKPSLHECIKIADEMVRLRELRWPGSEE